MEIKLVYGICQKYRAWLSNPGNVLKQNCKYYTKPSIKPKLRTNSFLKHHVIRMIEVLSIRSFTKSKQKRCSNQDSNWIQATSDLIKNHSKKLLISEKNNRLISFFYTLTNYSRHCKFVLVQLQHNITQRWKGKKANFSIFSFWFDYLKWKLNIPTFELEYNGIILRFNEVISELNKWQIFKKKTIWNLVYFSSKWNVPPAIKIFGVLRNLNESTIVAYVSVLTTNLTRRFHLSNQKRWYKKRHVIT